MPNRSANTRAYHSVRSGPGHTALWVILLAWSLVSTASQGDEKVSDRVSLSAEASGAVNNNLLRIVFFAQAEHKNASAAARQVNQQIQAAVAAIEDDPEIRHTTLNYVTQPVYEKSNIIAWRVRQNLLLESEKIARLSDRMGELQSSLQVESVNFDITPDRRREREDDLIREAIDHFRDRATVITRQFDASAYRIRTVQVDAGQKDIQPPFARARMSMEADTVAPSLSSGSQNLSVRVNGEIELVRQD